MTAAMDILSSVLAWIGVAFVLLAAIGILRLPDTYARMHAATKAATFGAIFVAMAVAVHFREAEIAVRSVALIGFLLLTAPVGAHLLGRSGYLSGVPLAEESVLDEAREHFEDEIARGEAAEREDGAGSG